MNSVIFDPSSFKNDLLKATQMNNLDEISGIIKNINEKEYKNHVDLSSHIVQLVNKLDPFDKDSVIDCIFENLSPEKKKLFSPLKVITHNYQKKQKFCCF